MGSLVPSADEISVLVETVQQLLTSTYVDISAISLMVYDVLINLDREIEYVWRSKWTISKVLFIIGRYYGLVYNIVYFVVYTKTNLSLRACKTIFWYTILGGDIMFSTIVNVILTMRLNAVYRNKKVLMLMIFLVTCEFALELYTCIIIGFQTTSTVVVIPSSIGITVPGCLSQVNITITMCAWIPCMVVATVFFIMTIVKAISEGYNTPKRLKDIKSMSPLIVVIIRDGALFYSMIFAILLLSVVLTLQSRSTAVNTAGPWVITVYSLAASRLVLNLREEVSRTHFGGTIAEQSIPEPVFTGNRGAGVSSLRLERRGC